MTRVTTQKNDDGSLSVRVDDTTLMDDLMDGLLLPLSIVSSDSGEFISKKVAGTATICWTVAAGLFMQRNGYKRAMDGKKPILTYGLE